jgi:hypothetical protein
LDQSKKNEIIKKTVEVQVEICTLKSALESTHAEVGASQNASVDYQSQQDTAIVKV